jgi:heme/copper-type cytochrome/quinol oxidase subunit 2
MPHATYLIFKQKRYSRRKVIEPRLKLAINPEDEDSKIIKHSSHPQLINNKIITEANFPPIHQYKYLKKKKERSENTSIVLSQRLIRTKRTLVLPSHVNITAITNSYDVIHSWFIPGLGLKMDCIPGRSTHHTFYIDNVGFYYGQCAEVCGRFHHHMPIRVCALPYEHFLL